MNTFRRAALAAVLLLTAASAAAAPAKEDPAAELAKITQGREPGKPRQCISLPQVYGTQVIPKTALVYRVGSTYYVNQLRSGADALNDDQIMITRTTGTQLCEMDVVHMVDRYTGFMRGFAILGKFVPYPPAPQPH